MSEKKIESSATTIRERMVGVLKAHLADAMSREATGGPTYWPPKSRSNPASRSRRRIHQERARRRLVAYLLEDR